MPQPLSSQSAFVELTGEESDSSGVEPSEQRGRRRRDQSDDFENDVVQSKIRPHDHHNEVYWLLLILGVGILFPWNAFVSAIDYFSALYPDLQPAFAFSSGYMIPNFLGYLPVLRWGKRLSFSVRILGSFALYLVILALTPVIALQEALGEWAFFITLGFVIVCGFADAIVQGALYGFSALFPDEFTSAIQTGTGVAGTTVVILRMITKASFDDTLDGLRESAVVYFALCALWMGVCLLAFLRLRNLPFSRFYLEGGIVSGEHAKSLDDKEFRSSLEVSLWQILKKIWSLAGLEGMQFAISLAIYPAILSLIPSHSWGVDQGWLTLSLMLVFNVFDAMGKTVPLFLRAERLPSPKVFWWVTLFRAMLIPCFLLAVKGIIFRSDDVLVVICAVFAGSNGVVACAALVLAPPRVEVQEREVAGTIMVFFLTFGLVSGVLIGDLLGLLVS